jgi:FKBP-type peptidyl-prolyl cis-trans isomerase|tara:strand:+ start:576 stop:791 length:216 start_codon:yes stop_codon:yes gene_type:complete
MGAGEVIEAWELALRGSKVGSKRMMRAGPSICYGAEGMGAKVPPNATLCFEMTVLNIEQPTDAQRRAFSAA